MTRALGQHEQEVLLALLSLGRPAHSASVVMAIEAATGRSVSPAAVFIALRRLEARGLTRSAKRPPAAGEGGRGRRTFTVTPKGVAALKELRERLQQLWDAGPLAEQT
jgi:PadR family transcriptional regulator